MRKFVGLVNGKSFDNEKDFEIAAKEAIKSSDGLLSIASFYSNVSDEEVKEVKEDEKELAGAPVISKEQYVLVNEKPEVLSNGELEYNVPERLASILPDAANKDEIWKTCDDLKIYCDDTLAIDEKRVKKLEADIERLQDELFETIQSNKELKARKRYYNTILDILDEVDDEVDAEADAEEIEDKKQVETSEPKSRLVERNHVRSPFLSLLNELGFFDYDF